MIKSGITNTRLAKIIFWVATAILAPILAIYLPNSAKLALSVLTAYPVALLTAACFGLLMALQRCAA